MKTMNHNEYREAMKEKTDAELLFIIKDAGEAERANPQGENASYYADEVNYAAMELQSRRNSSSKMGTTLGSR